MKTMILKSSESKNDYYVDVDRKEIGFIHPLLAWIIIYLKTHNERDIPATVILDDDAIYTHSQIQYYLSKYKFLKKNEFFQTDRESIKSSGKLTPELIEYKIANLNQIVFEITEACNLKCKYCGYGEFYFDRDIRTNKLLKFEYAKKVIDYIFGKWNSSLNSSLNAVSYISFYGGEPLIGMKLIRDIVEYTKTIKVNRKITFSVTTNGVLLHKYIDFLVSNDFQTTVSLDGNEYNNSYRVDNHGNSSFLRVYKNIINIRNKYPDYFKNKVFFHAVLHNRNTIDEICKFYEKEFNKTPSILEINSVGIHKDKLEEFSNIFKNFVEDFRKSEDPRLTEKLFLRSPDIRSASNFLINYSGNYYKSYNDLFGGNSEVNRIPTGTCLPFDRKMYVAANGKIFPCEKIGHQYNLGMVSNSGVEINLVQIANKYNLYYNKLEKQCSNCYNNEFCQMCIFNIDGLTNDKPICNSYESLSRQKRRFSNTLSFLERNPEMYGIILNDVIIE